MEVLLAILILILDQGTKLWAHSVLRAKPLVLIPGALELTYLENRGAVWGL
ncbi:MAG: signal peptidase II, partial [Clostridia bacterium]|nr:signal peptidase II [Clostridia bacterium]